MNLPTQLNPPLAISGKSGHPIAVLRWQEQLDAWNRGEYSLIPAPGIEVHPASIRVNDEIGFIQTGVDRIRVSEIEFKNEGTPWHWAGTFIFKGGDGTRSVRIDGRDVLAPPLYIFR